MRNVQSSASRGGECAEVAALLGASCSDAAAKFGAITVKTGAHVAFTSGPEPLFASGCATGAVFLGDVAQQVLLAQQSS